MNAIEVRGLVKAFGQARAVDELDLTVASGTVYGLLGPNGAGKTTVIRILATLLRPDSGTVKVLGRDVLREARELRGRIGLTGQHATVDEALTGRENLSMLARLHGHHRSSAMARADELLADFELEEAGGRVVKTYSGGMRRRLDIAAGLVVVPDLLFLDEPTTGLDPHSRSKVWVRVQRLADEGTTVLLTTQYLEEADQLADRLAVIDHGKVIAEGTSGELKASVGAGTLRVRLAEPLDRLEGEKILARMLGVPVVTEPGALSARVPSAAGVTAALAELTRAGIDVAEFALGRPSLDEVFLSLTGGAA